MLVNHTVVTDPSIQQAGCDLPHCMWFLLIASRQAIWNVLQTYTNGASPNQLSVNAVSSRLYTTRRFYPLTRSEAMAVAGIHLEAVANRVWGWKFRGTAPVGDLGDEVPQKPKQFADNIYRF